MTFSPTHLLGPRRFRPPVLFSALRCGRKQPRPYVGFAGVLSHPHPPPLPPGAGSAARLVPRRRRPAAPRCSVPLSWLVCPVAPSLPRRRKLVGSAPRAAGASWSEYIGGLPPCPRRGAAPEPRRGRLPPGPPEAAGRRTAVSPTLVACLRRKQSGGPHYITG